MLQSILVALDGSTEGSAAERLGIAWARRFGSLLVGVGVVDEPSLRGGQPADKLSGSFRPTYERLVAEARRQVERDLERFAIRCSQAGVSSKLLEESGVPGEQILLEAQRYDLILLGQRTHFHGGEHRSPCETIERVLRVSPRPVAIAPADLPEPLREGPVLVAFDGSLQSARAVQALVHLGLTRLGDVQVVTVHPESSVAAAQTADRAADFLRLHGVSVTALPRVSAEPPGKTFLNLARQLEASLLVMGAYGQPKFTELLLGSATCAALEQCPVPLLLSH